ncbi:MAG: hypothetical protein JJE17_11700 [Peptostreptococcaceae bacterium]|nr:hypothetical protein [Peptostreptococcaceae bacterium]
MAQSRNIIQVKNRFIYGISENISTDDEGVRLITKAYLLNLYPAKFSDRIDKIMQNLTYHFENIGDRIEINVFYDHEIEFYKTLLFIDIADSENGKKEMMRIIEQLTFMNYLTLVRTNNMTENIYEEYKFAINEQVITQALEKSRR